MTTEEQEQVISKTRMEALTDGVIAIVLTILVLELGGEAISQAKTEEDLTAALLAQWPVFLSYAVSFLVVGIFWVAHHTYFAFIPQVNETQLWLNLGWLSLVFMLEQSIETITVFGQTGFLAPGGTMNLYVGGVIGFAWFGGVIRCPMKELGVRSTEAEAA